MQIIKTLTKNHKNRAEKKLRKAQPKDNKSHALISQ
jgi:hypothetical protein